MENITDKFMSTNKTMSKSNRIDNESDYNQSQIFSYKKQKENTI